MFVMDHMWFYTIEVQPMTTRRHPVLTIDGRDQDDILLSSPPPAGGRPAAHENYRSVKALPTSATSFFLIGECLTMTVPKAGKRLGIGKNPAYESARRGEIPTIRLGKRLVVLLAALERMLRGELAPRKLGAHRSER
jgi:hypothetical protein